MTQNPTRASAPTNLRLTVGIDASTDAGRSKALRYGAGECLIGAKKLDEAFPDLTGEYILTFHALELALKSFLAKNGVSDRDLQYQYGHDLISLYNEACRQGLAVSFPDANETIAFGDEQGTQWELSATQSATALANKRSKLAGPAFVLATNIGRAI